MNPMGEEHISRVLFVVALLSWGASLFRRRLNGRGNRLCLWVALCTAGVVVGWITFLSAYRILVRLAVYSEALMTRVGLWSWALQASRLALPLWALGLVGVGGYFGFYT